MNLADKYSVPREIALLYEFLNSTDQRQYLEKGHQHVPSDHLATPNQFQAWMRAAGLLPKGGSIPAAEHGRAIELRTAIRSFLQLPPESRASVRELTDRLNKLSLLYPLAMQISESGSLALRPVAGVNGLARVLAELFTLAVSGHLDRLKMCDSPECHWVFFDRSKPANRRWCSSLLCGNRQKTRDYRSRIKDTK
jgi:predicted RNA-binding Zn ribbon-like protein